MCDGSAEICGLSNKRKVNLESLNRREFVCSDVSVSQPAYTIFRALDVPLLDYECSFNNRPRERHFEVRLRFLSNYIYRFVAGRTLAASQTPRAVPPVFTQS